MLCVEAEEGSQGGGVKLCWQALRRVRGGRSKGGLWHSVGLGARTSGLQPCSAGGLLGSLLCASVEGRGWESSSFI